LIIGMASILLLTVLKKSKTRRMKIKPSVSVRFTS
jgi:hypothetical protein